MHLNRRAFLAGTLGSFLLAGRKPDAVIMTINGPIKPSQLGVTLIHEHFLVDFIGADQINSSRWQQEEVLRIVLTYLKEAQQAGVKSIFDCTPAFLGRDVALLARLATETGLQLITNTGYYGARNNKFLPAWAFTETEQELADRWVKEYEYGIDGTSIRPGFIKIGVDQPVEHDGPLTEIHQKLVKAACLTHLKTGLTICSHTGAASAALQQVRILANMGVGSDAFVWVHAQDEKSKVYHSRVAKLGAWVSLDNIGWGDFDNYAESIVRLKKDGLLKRTLISHDAGWYEPGKPENPFQGYTNIFKELIPRLRQKGFTDKDIDQLLIRNPAQCMRIKN